AAGEVVPHQVLENDERFWMEVLKPNRKRCVRVLVPVNVPALGYTTLYAQPAAGGAPPATDLVAGERGAENAFVSLVIEADGGLTITDRATGHTYTGQHHFVDIEDAGDEYTFCPLPENSQAISTAGHPAQVERVEAGPCRAAFRVTWTLD